MVLRNPKRVAIYGKVASLLRRRENVGEMRQHDAAQLLTPRVTMFNKRQQSVTLRRHSMLARKDTTAELYSIDGWR